MSEVYDRLMAEERELMRRTLAGLPGVERVVVIPDSLMTVFILVLGPHRWDTLAAWLYDWELRSPQICEDYLVEAARRLKERT